MTCFCCVTCFIQSYIKLYGSSLKRNNILPTIETCFNCFGTRSSDAKKNKKTTKPSGKFISYATILIPPLPGGRGGVSKMAPVPKGEIFSMRLCTLRKKYYLPKLTKVFIKSVKQRLTVFILYRCFFFENYEVRKEKLFIAH